MQTNEVAEIINTIGNNEVIIVFGSMLLCGVVAIVFGTLASVLNRHSTEKSRREIAAYIAEGSLTPEQGEALMRVDPGEVKK